MKILAFESSAKAAGTALLDDGVLLADYMQNCGLTHSVTLLQMAENMLSGCGVSVHDIDAVAVAKGLGSFTGVRIGVAAAKGFAWGRQLPCCGVSTLEAMVRGAAMTDGIYCACMDARRAQVYNALFSMTGGCLTRLCEDRAVSLDELGEDLKKYEKTIFTVGDGAKLCYNSLAQTVPALRLLPEHLQMQRASGVALAAWSQYREGTPFSSASELVPSYLRVSQAERERMEKQKNQ